LPLKSWYLSQHSPCCVPMDGLKVFKLSHAVPAPSQVAGFTAFSKFAAG
jgi:hypothetical protein